ncbi:hypothetical protein [Streptomyces sp. NPDC090025]|uniref:hypothetical protein n=1 Tax=Streptomyces sp. NPDC090025 TaxID=3365922 RepID=UPI003836C29B
MSVRQTTKTVRGVVAAAVVVGLGLGLAGCGGDDPAPSKPTKATSAPAKNGAGGNTQPQSQEPDQVLGTTKGPNGFEIVINSAERDAGGFITIKGTLKNTANDPQAIPAGVQGDETEVVEHGDSFGGATLVDLKEKKRYYVLRDTEGRPLTTTGLNIVAAGATAPVFMQFPAPPATTGEVSFQLPTFTPTTIKLS